MKLLGGVYFDQSGLSTSMRGMHMQTELLSVISENMMGFDKIGYQEKENIVSSFAEYIGVHAHSVVQNDRVGRLYSSGNNLDFALAKQGYFQYLTPEGIKQTRDGRFKLDKDGYLLTQEGYNVLSKSGIPVKIDTFVDDISKVKVDTDGSISVFNEETGKMEHASDIAVVTKDGNIADEPDVRQGFVESGNVRIEEQFFNAIPVRRNFQANRQMFVMQNDLLNQTIQSLGSSS